MAVLTFVLALNAVYTGIPCDRCLNLYVFNKSRVNLFQKKIITNRNIFNHLMQHLKIRI